ncbi:iron ion transporter [Cryptococcus wingfieldii CBS 7118]|uniref:Iron ion transporter n=1 Tax=Cryptococcus wingfieldii CBS 7118 TaxID=1295528 RepID=A0A1E3JR89_9TREE|nr:iron ion transporter [Cryptococcus wingfieldii CBS 7118]ODO03380.1 iron ion transporter [Cryptococcus wingfieldii CBS 7118]
MALTDYFSPVAFFILLRESLEAGIIIAVLLGFITQIIPSKPPRRPSQTLRPSRPSTPEPRHSAESDLSNNSGTQLISSTSDIGSRYGASRNASPSRYYDEEHDNVHEEEVVLGGDVDRLAIMKKMRVQIWSGAMLGGSVAIGIGAIFLYVFYRYTRDLWQDAENLWEGGFCLLAAFLILVMSLAFLRLPHAQTKWRLKLLSAYQTQSGEEAPSPPPHYGNGLLHPHHAHRHKKRTNKANAILFGLPFITVLREGLEGIVFLGGIGLSEKPSSVFGGGLAGLIVGALCAYLLFSSTSPLSVHTFTAFSSLLLFYIGAGLCSRSAYALERQYFINHVGAAAAESGNGPGSYRVKGNIWHLTWWDPEPGSGDNWAQVAQAVVGWNNTGSWWTISTYIFYWVAITATLVYMKWKEGRCAILGILSPRGKELERSRRQRGGIGEDDEEVLLDDRSEIGE